MSRSRLMRRDCRTAHAIRMRQDLDDASMEIADAKLPYGYAPWPQKEASKLCALKSKDWAIFTLDPCVWPSRYKNRDSLCVYQGLCEALAHLSAPSDSAPGHVDLTRPTVNLHSPKVQTWNLKRRP